MSSDLAHERVNFTTSLTKVSPFKAVKRIIYLATAQVVFLFLVAFQTLNALTIQTFFSPDE
jgi:hypothetical protein